VLSGAGHALHHPQLRAVLLEADSPGLQRTMEEAGFARYSYDLSTAVSSAPPTAQEPPAATTSFGSATSPSCRSGAAQLI
jgi:hypothetical protein